MLEYATGGDLRTFLQSVKPPSNIEHRTAFWINFFKLLLGLDAVHNLEPSSNDKESWFLEGYLMPPPSFATLQRAKEMEDYI